MTRRIIAALLLVPGLAPAHHGWSEYDSSKPLKLTGRILESGYEHPHGYVKLDSAGQIYRVVLAPPSRMEFRGLGKESLKAGASGYVLKSVADRDLVEACRATMRGEPFLYPELTIEEILRFVVEARRLEVDEASAEAQRLLAELDHQLLDETEAPADGQRQQHGDADAA